MIVALAEPQTSKPDTGRVLSAEREKEAILHTLSNICTSDTFRNSPRMQSFLRYIVVETIEGRANGIKSYVIATDVFDRSPSAAIINDSVVRTAGTRLRLLLERYNSSPKPANAIVITLPRGAYIPDFNRNPAYERSDPAGVEFRKTLQIGWPLCCALVLLVILVMAYGLISPEQPSAAPTLFVQEMEYRENGKRLNAFSTEFPALISGQMANYGGANIIDASSSRVQPNQLTHTHNPSFSLGSSLLEVDESVFLLWKIVDVDTHEILWADRDDLGPLERLDTSLIAKRLAVQVLGLNGALSKISAAVGNPVQCVTRAERISLVYHSDFGPSTRSCLEKLVRDQPTNADAWGLLVQVYFRLARRAASFGDDPKPYQNLLQQAATQSMLLAPNSFSSRLAEMYASIDAKNFGVFADVACELIDDFHDPHLKIRFGAALVAIGRLEEGTNLLRQGLNETEYKETGPFLWLAYASYFAGDYQGGLQKLSYVTREDHYQLPLLKTVLLAELGHAADARIALAELHRLRPGYEDHLDFDLRNANFSEAYIEKMSNSLQKLKAMNQ
ncbi:hypothetical protein [Agrobacterium sp. V1]|uniref:hypothetical protein n=1 Tax=Agrobacterium sp. V1 TaxID=3061957 RepID=UPI002673A470|nr:hypothetical protein [Agrobacterium sp. V1]MDO3443957.1 hypothetical protein [Agrobacterium sp. V1]